MYYLRAVFRLLFDEKINEGSFYSLPANTHTMRTHGTPTGTVVICQVSLRRGKSKELCVHRKIGRDNLLGLVLTLTLLHRAQAWSFMAPMYMARPTQPAGNTSTVNTSPRRRGRLQETDLLWATWRTGNWKLR